jgi:conjugal transfer pilus assembly protein TraE
MNPNNAKNERDALKGQMTFQRNVIYSLVGLSFALTAGWGWTVMNSTVAIVPPEVKRPYEIGSNFGNKEYLADMANYVLSTVLTVSPDSVDFNNKVILKMTDPDGYGKLKSDLEAAALRLRRDRVSTVWVARKEEISEREKRVKIAGRLKTYIADVLTSDREKEYIVEFSITSSGRLYVLKVQEVVKPDPVRSSGHQPG